MERNMLVEQGTCKLIYVLEGFCAYKNRVGAKLNIFRVSSSCVLNGGGIYGGSELGCNQRGRKQSTDQFDFWHLM